MNYSANTGKLSLQDLFEDNADVETAARYLTLFAQATPEQGGTVCYRDLSGHFYAVVTEPGENPKTIEYSERSEYILKRLQRGGFLQQAAKPEYFITGNGGYRMTVAQDRVPHNV